MAKVLLSAILACALAIYFVFFFDYHYVRVKVLGLEPIDTTGLTIEDFNSRIQLLKVGDPLSKSDSIGVVSYIDNGKLYLVWSGRVSELVERRKEVQIIHSNGIIINIYEADVGSVFFD